MDEESKQPQIVDPEGLASILGDWRMGTGRSPDDRYLALEAILYEAPDGKRFRIPIWKLYARGQHQVVDFAQLDIPENVILRIPIPARVPEKDQEFVELSRENPIGQGWEVWDTRDPNRIVAIIQDNSIYAVDSRRIFEISTRTLGRRGKLVVKHRYKVVVDDEGGVSLQNPGFISGIMVDPGDD